MATSRQASMPASKPASKRVSKACGVCGMPLGGWLLGLTTNEKAPYRPYIAIHILRSLRLLNSYVCGGLDIFHLSTIAASF